MGKSGTIILKNKKLYVKKSNLPGAGYGLFTYLPIKKGESLGPYMGKLLTMEECHEDKYLPLWSHMLDMTNIEGIEPYVALHPPKNMILRYINHAPQSVNGIKIRGKHSVNVEFKQIPNFPYIEIISIKDIPAHNEIFLNYGPGFSKKFLQNASLKNYYLKTLKS